jgi:PST family polysaccharide transporter
MGMLFKAVSWSMGYILIAKGDSNMFLKTALGFNSISLILNILGYFFYGLEGLGFSFFVYYLIHFFVLKIITRKKYDFYFENKFYKNYLICISMCFIAFSLRYIPNLILKYSLMSSMILISVVFVLYQLNNKVELKSLINSLIKKKND